jgi:hypothetical protein
MTAPLTSEQSLSSSLATGRFFYPEDWGSGGPAPCDQHLAFARQDLVRELQIGLDFQDADVLTRLIDKLIETHVAAYAYKNPGHHHE